MNRSGAIVNRDGRMSENKPFLIHMQRDEYASLTTGPPNIAPLGARGILTKDSRGKSSDGSFGMIEGCYTDADSRQRATSS